MHGPLNVKIHLRHILVEICVYCSIDRESSTACLQMPLPRLLRESTQSSRLNYIFFLLCLYLASGELTQYTRDGQNNGKSRQYRNTIVCVSCTERTFVVSSKVKWSRYRPGVAQRVGRGIALLFHDRGTRRGWVVSSTPRPHFTSGKDPVPIL